MDRLSTGVPGLDSLIQGGIPRGFMVAVAGEPGTGKTILCLHFISEGLRRGELCIYVTTEESKTSILEQASQLGLDLNSGLNSGKLVVVDSLSGELELNVDQLFQRIAEAKRSLGYTEGRLVIDSIPAFWLDKPAMSRRICYGLKRFLAGWRLTTLVTAQYSVTSEEAFGFGVEHVADGIIRFKKEVFDGTLRKFMLVEKLRQTQHSHRVHEVTVKPGSGPKVLGPAQLRQW